MELQFKLILPLCKPLIPKECLTKEAGFVEAFTSDINNPALTDHIILLYDYNIDSAEKGIRFETLRSLGLKPRAARINKRWYMIYTLEINSNEARHYKVHEYPTFTKESIKKIIDFWSSSDEEIVDFLINPTSLIRKSKYSGKILQEFDCMDDVEFSYITIQRKPKGH